MTQKQVTPLNCVLLGLRASGLRSRRDNWVVLVAMKWPRNIAAWAWTLVETVGANPRPSYIRMAHALAGSRGDSCCSFNVKKVAFVFVAPSS